MSKFNRKKKTTFTRGICRTHKRENLTAPVFRRFRKKNIIHICIPKPPPPPCLYRYTAIRAPHGGVNNGGGAGAAAARYSKRVGGERLEGDRVNNRCRRQRRHAGNKRRAASYYQDVTDDADDSNDVEGLLEIYIEVY